MNLLCRVTYHLRRWVDDLHLLQDGGSIVGDEHLAFWVLDLRQRNNSLGACSIKIAQIWKMRFSGNACQRGTYHLVHATWSETGSDDIGNSYAHTKALTTDLNQTLAYLPLAAIMLVDLTSLDFSEFRLAL
jgi:hypothetical protein